MAVIKETYINTLAGQAVTVHHRSSDTPPPPGLSIIFTIMCIVDLFGVFPIIALPASVIACGVYGIPLVLAVLGLQLYTAVLLGRSWLLAQEITPHIREKNRYPYAAVAELAFGPAGRRVVTTLLNATVFGSGIPNFILAAQSLQIFWWKITGGTVSVTYCVWMLLLALLLCPIMWLGSPKDMKPIAIVSVCIVSTVALSTWACIATDSESPASTGTLLDYTPRLEHFLSAYGVLAFQTPSQLNTTTRACITTDSESPASTRTLLDYTPRLQHFLSVFGFDIHPMLLTIQVDMRDSRQINKAVIGGFTVTVVMFTVTAILAADRYGVDVNSNILQGIPPSLPLYLVALLVTLQLCLSSAVGNSVLFQQVEDFLHVPRNFCWQRCLVRSSIVAVAIFLAESVPRFDLVMGLVGSTLTGPLMFIFPPIFFLKLCYIKSKMAEKNPLKHSKHITLPSDWLRHSNAIYGEQNGKHNGTQNGGQNGYHNGDIDPLKTPLILSERFKTKYRTFDTKYKKCKEIEDEYKIKWYDVLLALIVMSMGIGATVVATYSSWANSIEYASFSPPCLLNASLAARSFIEQLSQ